MAEGAAREQALRAAVDRAAHDALRLATGILAALLAFFALVDPLIVPSHDLPIALLDAAVGVGLLVAHLALRRGAVPPRGAHAIGAAAGIAITATTLYDMYVLADPQQTMYLMLVIVGAGAIFLHARALQLVTAVTIGGWLAVAFALPQIDWTNFGFSLLAASVLGVLVHTVRHRSFLRMEALRLAEAARKEELEAREVALQGAVEALRESEERYRRLVEGAPDAFLVHEGGRILYANTAARRLFGAADTEVLVGRGLLDLVDPQDRARAGERLARVERDGRATEPAELRCARLDGGSVRVESRDQPVAYLGRHAVQTVLRDLTDRERAEAERAVASQRLMEIDRLREMDRVKTQFVNTISHELRTPLTPIKVQLHILKGATDPASMQKARDVLERNVQRLASLVDELLEVARIQAGTLRLAKAPLDVSQVVATALESYEDVARARGIELVAKLEPGMPALGDDKRLQQVLYNLLGNAFKFTPAGGRIEVEVRREAGAARVSVRDSGAGIEPDDIARLFEPFSQAHDTMQRTDAGTGLGLYISRGIVEGHGGRIWAESPGAGKGATFAFTLPLAPAAA